MVSVFDYRLQYILYSHLFTSVCVQVYTRFVEIGRVALLTSGPQAGKLVVIIDLVDQRRVCVCVSLSLSLSVCLFVCKGIGKPLF